MTNRFYEKYRAVKFNNMTFCKSCFQYYDTTAVSAEKKKTNFFECLNIFN